MKHMPPFKSLQFFVVAAQLQSFKLAAQQLNVTQAAVSQQIRLLEEHLQVKLFERLTRQTRLTSAGLRLLPFAQRGFDELRNGVQAVTGDPAPNLLRISTLHSFTSLWLLPRLHEFQQAHPEIMVQLAPTNKLITFKDSNIDLAIRMGRGGYTDVTEKKILSDKLVIVASPELLGGVDTKDPRQVFALPFIEDTSKGINKILRAYCDQVNVAYEALVPRLQSNNAVPLIENAVAGRGFLMTSSSLVVDHLRTGRLQTLLDFSCLSPYSLYLIAPEQHFTWHKVQLFENWFVPQVMSSFQDLDQW